MIEYKLMNKNGTPINLGDIDKIYELDKLFFEEHANDLEKGHSREFPINGSKVCIFYRDKGYSRVIIPEHEKDTKTEFESKTNLRLEEIKCQ